MENIFSLNRTPGFDHDYSANIIPSNKERTWFFGIGISVYNSSEILNLSNAVKDMNDIILTLERKFEGFTSDMRVILKDEDATLNRILQEFDEFRRKIHDTDRLLIYFAGHGHLDKSNIGDVPLGFWIPTEGQPDKWNTMIHNSILWDYLMGIKAKHILVISDSCFSGSFFRTSMRGSSLFHENRNSRWAISSGREDQEVSDGEGENSPFAKLLIQLFQDANQDLRMSDLISKIEVQIENGNGRIQTPKCSPLHISSHKDGEFVFKLKEVSEEEQLWKDCLLYKDIKDIEYYLEEYPSGKYYAEVKSICEKINSSEEKIMLEFCFKGGPSLLNYYKNLVKDNKNIIKDIRDKTVQSKHDLRSKFDKTVGYSKPDIKIIQSENRSLKFGISIYPVTIREYNLYLKSLNIDYDAGYDIEVDYPVTNVTYFDALSYCSWLSIQTNEKYRLPTVEEWIYAARSANSESFEFAGGDNLDNLGWYNGNSELLVQPVGRFEGNSSGVFDMSGNIYEWCIDWEFNNNDHSHLPEILVKAKGGSFNRDSEDCKISAIPLLISPESIADDIGFRLILENT